jgi:hypothetical protein
MGRARGNGNGPATSSSRAIRRPPYRTDGGRSSKQPEQSFGDDLREAADFVLKVEIIAVMSRSSRGC